MNNTYVIDGSNVCWWYGQTHPNVASIQPLLTVLIALLDHGDDFYCVFDASVTHTIGNNGNEVDAASIEKMLADHPERFYRVTGATRADGAILHDADHHSRSIITNDIYRDFKDKYPWLSHKYTERLIQGNLQPSGLMTIEKLSYGQLSLQIDTEIAINRLNELLAVRKAPAIPELDRLLQQRTKSLDEMNNVAQQHEVQIMQLTAQIGELFEKTRELSNQLAKRKYLSSGVDSISIKLNETQTEADDEQSLLNHENKSKDNSIHEKVCIRNAKAALEAFLEPYPDDYGRPNKIPFDGSTWDVAVKKLQIYFDRTKVCTHCYTNHSGYDKEGDRCRSCQKGVMTVNPKDLWQIVMNFAPQ